MSSITEISVPAEAEKDTTIELDAAKLFGLNGSTIQPIRDQSN